MSLANKMKWNSPIQHPAHKELIVFTEWGTFPLWCCQVTSCKWYKMDRVNIALYNEKDDKWQVLRYFKDWFLQENE